MVTIGQPTATLDTPVELLLACHRRIEDRLATLERAAGHVFTDRDAALSAVRKSIHFLESNGAQHTADEEESVFPRLRLYLDPEELAYLDSLEHQHRATEAVFADLKAASSELAAAEEISPGLHERFSRLVEQIAGLYRPHIQSEDKILMSIARARLDAGDLQSIAVEMRLRRSGPTS